jgi:hypothetical protein
MLVNLADDPEILKDLASDDQFLETLLARVTVSTIFNNILTES